MSVLIKMAMPQNCRECRLMDTVYRLDGRRYICLAYLNEITNLKERLDTCPLEELPSVEPKHGKWMAIGNTGLAACECGYITDRYSIYKYCPNCGARMYGDVKDGE